MSEPKYCDVLLNLRNTGVNAMKSYYASSFNSSFEKHRPADHGPHHFKPTYDKYSHGVTCLQSPPKARKYDCTSSYQSLDSRKPRCEPTAYNTSEKMLSYRLAESKIHPGYPGYPVSSPTERARVDVHNVSSYTHKLAQYCRDKIPTYENNNPHCKRTYESISSHHNTSEEFHIDVKPPRPIPNAHQPRFKYTPFRNESSFNTNHHAFYPQKSELEKPYPSNHHTNYENYRPLPPTPCSLPCCSAFNYDTKTIESRSYYGRRGESLSPTYSPSLPAKKSDYPEHVQGLSSREPGENSAFSPIRPSNIRRVHSTESGYSSESNGTCHSSSSYKEVDACKNPKCCAMLDLNSPTIGHKVCRDLSSQMNLSDRPKHMNGEQRDALSTEHERGLLTNDHHMRYPSNQRSYEFEDLRVPRHDYNGSVSRTEFRERRMSGSRYQETVWREHVNNEKNREYFNVENLRRTHSADEETRRQISDDNKRWKSASDFNRLIDPRPIPTQTNDNKLEVCDEASRAAMKAFDAHIRKMIAKNRDNETTDFPTKFNHSNNFSHFPIMASSEERHPLNHNKKHNETLNKSVNDKPTNQFNDKHSISHLCKVSPTKKNEKDSYSKGDKSPSPNKEKDSLIQVSKEEPYDNKQEPSPEQLPNDKTPSEQPCDSTQLTGPDKGKGDCVDESDKLSTEEKEKDETSTKEKEKVDPPSPLPELQCPAVDSTLNDEAASPTIDGVNGLLGLTRVANEHLGQALAKEKKRSKNNNCLHLWQFLRRMLDQEQDKVGRCIEWTNRETGEFRLIKTAVIADLWGQSKNRTCMTYEKMARAMRYYYKMNILEKVPHKRLHFRFGERILSKVLHPTTSKPFLGKNKIFDDMYNMNKRNLNANYSTAAILKPNNNIVNDFRTGHNLKYLQMQAERGKNTIPYLPTDLPGVTLPPYYNEHNNNILHHNLPHIGTNRMSEMASSREHTQKRTEPNVLPCNIPRKIVPPNSVNTSPGSNPSVSPYSGEETPETWSDIDSNDELVVDTDSE